MINIKLPWPPTVNTYYTIARGRKILSKKGRDYKKYAMPPWTGNLVSGQVEVNIEAHPPDKRKRDLDNILKPILDLLTNNGVWKDDSQVDVLRIRRRHIAKPGYVRVYITEIDEV